MRERDESLFPGYEEIYEYLGNTESQFLDCLSGITYPCPNYEVIRKHAITYSIEYIYEGEGVIQEDDKIYKVSAGDFFILHHGCYHHYYTNPKKPWKKIFLTSDGDPTYINTLLNLFKIDKIVLFKSINSPVRLEEIFELFKSDKSDITHELEQIVFLLISDLAYLSKLKIEQKNTLLKAKAFIDKRITTRIPVTEVASYVGLDNAYFSRAFKKEYGLSPSKYITNKKIEISRQLLSETSMSIKSIANHLAFTDATHFIKNFKSIHNITPDKYRSIHTTIRSSDKYII